MSRPHTWDIFCKVVDNYGDAAVCWRLAQQLAAEHGAAVRLWVSDLAPLHALCPDVAPGLARQSVASVEVRAWPSVGQSAEPAEIVIEAFGCGLPDSCVRAMAQRAPPPLWIVLEYLSAEPWVPQHHGLPSPHPRRSIPRYFFFPGFGEGTGGVLREAGLRARRDAFGAEARRALWGSLGLERPGERATVVSIFAYEDAPVETLLDAWACGTAPVVACIPQGKLTSRVTAHLGEAAHAGATLRRGNLEVRLLPFVPQPQYDALLWSCDCNFVRGEDSFVRAQWAGLPFVWNIYPQAEGAHERKLKSFLELYCRSLPAEAAAATKNLWRAWNGTPGVPVDAAWREYWAHRAMLAAHARSWADALGMRADLAANLVKFCAERLKY